MSKTETIAIKHEDGEISEERLERIVLFVQNAISRDLFVHAPDVSFDAMANANAGFMTNSVMVRLSARILGRRGAYEVVDIGPSSCWWHLYERFAPRWLQRRHRAHHRFRVMRPMVLYPNIREGIPALDWETFGTFEWPRDRELIESYRRGKEPDKWLSSAARS